ncbi:Sugar transporter domain containing protein [Naviculisporaceae sp. PSN 640]
MPKWKTGRYRTRREPRRAVFMATSADRALHHNTARYEVTGVDVSVASLSNGIHRQAYISQLPSMGTLFGWVLASLKSPSPVARLAFIRVTGRWLLVKGREGEAEKSLRRLRGDTLKEGFLVEKFVEMRRGIEEKRKEGEMRKGDGDGDGVMWEAFWDMFRGVNLRIITLGIVVSHSSPGIWLFIAYSTYFFLQAGIQDSFQMSIFFTVAGLIGTMLGMYLMYKHMGRRTMMLTGSVLSGLCMMGAALADTIKPKSPESSKAVAAFSVLFMFVTMGFSNSLSCRSRVRSQAPDCES